MSKTLIRSAVIEDAEHISLLGRITFTETFGKYFRDQNDLLEYYENTFSVKKIRESISKSTNKYWIAFVDLLPVGYSKLKLNSNSEFSSSPNSCQLQKIYILKDFLSKKIGYELQKLLIKKAIELKYDRIWLSVLNENNRAIGFYKKNNFIHIGNHNFQIGKEFFEFTAMEKELINVG
jgi:ribosomal protein S18 acetylase RimI-like enzyme